MLRWAVSLADTTSKKNYKKLKKLADWREYFQDRHPFGRGRSMRRRWWDDSWRSGIGP
jgi:hypothetical protein